MMALVPVPCGCLKVTLQCILMTGVEHMFLSIGTLSRVERISGRKISLNKFKMLKPYQVDCVLKPYQVDSDHNEMKLAVIAE